MNNLFEGGNIFKDANGEQTRRINKSEIPTTIQWLETITGLDFTMDKDEDEVPIKWLGTTGRKESSGDLDLSVDETQVSKDQLKTKLIAWCKSQGIPDAEILNTKTNRAGWIQLTGDSVHFKTPINGDVKNGFAQTDFMFSADPSWQQGSMLGGKEGSEFKGEHRHILLASIARARGYKYSYKNGLMDPETNATLPNGKDFNFIAKTLLGQTATVRDTRSVEAILEFIMKLPNYEELIAGARETLGRSGIELPKKAAVESYQVGSIGWMRKMIDISK
jgi:hypothetical protein